MAQDAGEGRADYVPPSPQYPREMTGVSSMWIEWLKRGYADARDTRTEGRTAVYKRAPDTNPPPVPDFALPEEWQAYFEGWHAGIQDNVAPHFRR